MPTLIKESAVSHNMKPARLLVPLCGTICLMLFGCGAFRPNGSGPATLERKVPRYARVALVEFFDRSRYPGTAEQFTGALREQLSNITASTDFVVIGRSALPGFEDPFTGGKLPVASLAQARRDYHADAVIIGAIEDHNPYYKPSVAVSIKLIDTAQGAVICEFSETRNANTRRVSDDIGIYYRENFGRDDCRFGPDVFLISPRYFLKYAARRAAERVADRM